MIIFAALGEKNNNHNDDDQSIRCTIDKGYKYKENSAHHPQSRLAQRLLGGYCGIEIGPASYAPFGLNTIHVGLTEEMHPGDYKLYREHQIEVAGCAAEIDIGREADDLYGFPDSTVPFIIHSHVWEHLYNPLKALEEWVRVLVPTGLLYIVVPKRDALPEDALKPLTTIEELIAQYDRPKPPLSELQAGEHLHVFSVHLLLEIMFWYNQKHYPSSALSIVSLLELDDTVEFGHQITWRIHKDIDINKTEIKILM